MYRYILVNHLTVNQSFKLLLEPLMPICQLVIFVISNGFRVISNQQISSEALWRLDGDLQRKKSIIIWWKNFDIYVFAASSYATQKSTFTIERALPLSNFYYGKKCCITIMGVRTFITLFWQTPKSPVQDQTTYENTKITSKIVSRYVSRKKMKQIGSSR